MNHTVSDILERFPQLLMKRSFKGLFYNLIAVLVDVVTKGTGGSVNFGGILRELNNINLRIWKKTVRLQTKEHQPYVLRFGVFRQSVHNIHASAQIEEIHMLGFLHTASSPPL